MLQKTKQKKQQLQLYILYFPIAGSLKIYILAFSTKDIKYYKSLTRIEVDQDESFFSPANTKTKHADCDTQTSVCPCLD